jgi:hypothetical protein
MNAKTDTKKLTLRRETLRELTTPELRRVVGGALSRYVNTQPQPCYNG